jgi:hypothetical protein
MGIAQYSKCIGSIASNFLQALPRSAAGNPLLVGELSGNNRRINKIRNAMPELGLSEQRLQ